jgi:DNA-binding response OmpR family regulator
MKKIIIARGIMHAIGSGDTIFGRGTIATYTARTSEEILNIHGVRKADLIITESTLPLMGGAKLCAEIRKNDDLKNVSIIMACDGTEESMAQCREARANAVVQKPVDPIQLFSKVSELIMIPQRKELRIPFRAIIRSEGEQAPFSGTSHNISISGVLFKTDRELKKGERFVGTIAIDHRGMAIECAVVRVAAVGGIYQCGVKFLNLDTKSLIIIEQLVKGSIRY